MKTAKITEIGKFRKWEGPHGDVFYIPLTLDNGENITLGKKKEDAFKVGDTVNYEENGEGKRKEVKLNNFQPRDNSKGAMVGMAIKTAFEAMYDPKEQNFNETIALAYRILDEAQNMLDGKKPEKVEKVEPVDEDLPF